jgi:hypothetical protein
MQRFGHGNFSKPACRFSRNLSDSRESYRALVDAEATILPKTIDSGAASSAANYVDRNALRITEGARST